jgi:hypothetical protein
MATTVDIEAALADLRAAQKPNISATAVTHGLERSQLSKLYNRRIGTKQDYDDNRGLLSKQQHLKFLELVNRLTREGLPPKNEWSVNSAGTYVESYLERTGPGSGCCATKPRSILPCSRASIWTARKPIASGNVEPTLNW